MADEDLAGLPVTKQMLCKLHSMEYAAAIA
jgi:hypothetical protein